MDDKARDILIRMGASPESARSGGPILSAFDEATRYLYEYIKNTPRFFNPDKSLKPEVEEAFRIFSEHISKAKKSFIESVSNPGVERNRG